MPTSTELTAEFNTTLDDLVALFVANLDEARRWGTQWELVREDRTLNDAAPVWQAFGFSSAYARTDGMGGYVSFWVRFTEGARGRVEVNALVATPYAQRGVAYNKRSHEVALRLLEFCAAPYEEIHPNVGKLKRLAGGLLPNMLRDARG